MSKKTRKRWKVTDYRFVVFLDILGFKDLVMRNTHNEIYKLLTFITDKKTIIDYVKNSDGMDPSDTELYSVTFSDSIVIFSKNDSLEHFEILTIATSYFYSKLIEKAIPVKGAIAHGQISVNKSSQIFFGQPIIDAYILEEDLDYMGIVAHNSIDTYISKIDSNLNFDLEVINSYYFDIKTPFKYGSLSHLNIEWHRFLIEYYLREKSELPFLEFANQKICNFKNQSSGRHRKYIDNTLNVILEFKKYAESTLNKFGSP